MLSIGKHSNALFFLAPDTQRACEVIDAARRLMALRSIDEHKATKAQLTDEQLKDLTGRLKEAAARWHLVKSDQFLILHFSFCISPLTVHAPAPPPPRLRRW